MLFLVYSDINSSNIQNSLGMPEYSYYFVLKSYMDVLPDLGQVVTLDDPAREADVLFDQARQQGEDCVLLCFTPPHRAPIDLRCPTICIIAWEFSNLPYETWDDNPRNDWRMVLARHGRAITLSSYSEQVVRQEMGENFRVRAIPAPVYNEQLLRDADFIPRDPPYTSHTSHASRTLRVSCTVIDNGFQGNGGEPFVKQNASGHIQGSAWQGESAVLDFNAGSANTGCLGGFYQPESWGTWSRSTDPWIMLPFRLAGRYKIGIEMAAYGHNVWRTIQISVGEQSFPLKLTDNFTRYDYVFDFRPDVSLIQLTGLDTSTVPNARDPRTMGVGLRHIWIEREASAGPPPAQAATASHTFDIPLNGVVYTSIFNPCDGRKNWLDMLAGFCFAFRDEPRAVLLMKMTHHAEGSFLGHFHDMLQRIGPIKCRVVILHGYLDDDQYRQLIEVSTYCVNTSHCEGLCLPLMEFMSIGIPAVAPGHTAMMDYVNHGNAFVIDSGLEPAIWPQDPRELFRTLRYRIDWRSMVKAFRDSFQTALDNPALYRAMSRQAQAAQFAFCSHDSVNSKLRDFFNLPATADSKRP